MFHIIHEFLGSHILPNILFEKEKKKNKILPIILKSALIFFPTLKSGVSEIGWKLDHILHILVISLYIKKSYNLFD